jgi:hypothetical protein
MPLAIFKAACIEVYKTFAICLAYHQAVNYNINIVDLVTVHLHFGFYIGNGAVNPNL